MKVFLYIIVFFIPQILVSQVEKEVFYDLTIKIVTETSVKDNLMKNCKPSENSKFFNKDVLCVAEINIDFYPNENYFQDSLLVYFSDVEDLFMDGIYYGFCPKEIIIKKNRLVYNFFTWSAFRLNADYIKGSAIFKKIDEDWILIKTKLKKAKPFIVIEKTL